MTVPVLGVCYYPEHWPEEQWSEDARRMRQTGLTWVRIGEFAWSRIEPKPDDLRFEWLDRAIETLGEAGLKVILGTPTATPPRWMLTKHPDMLACDREGRPRGFGSRRHYCFSHGGYRDESARIVELLGARYGANPHVAAWQTDNEYGCHDTALSYSPVARDGFRRWLAERYGSVDRLNDAWGNVFWSMEYGAFEEIGLPNLTVTEANPSHWLDFYRYSSEQVRTFNKVQTDILRRYTNAPLIHNYMGRTVEFDHFDVAGDLDVASWDSYPLGFIEDRVDVDDEWKRAFIRQGDPDNQAFHHDLYRAVGRGRWWVMEQQPGPVNWAPFNAAPLPGMVRLWTWEAFAHGAEAVCYFRWRQAPMAQEQMHAGLLRPDSGAAPGLAEAETVAREIGNGAEITQKQARVGLVFDYRSAWAWRVQPQGRTFDYFRLVFETYRGLRRAGLNIDILPPDIDDLSGYALVLAPGLFAYPESFRRAMKNFGGTLVLGPRSGAKTQDMRIPAAMPPDVEGLDVTVTHAESLRPDLPVPLAGGGSFRIWREFTDGSAPVIEKTMDGHAALRAAGGIVYLCGWPDQDAMRRLMHDLAGKAGLEPLRLPDGVRRRSCADETFWFNYSTEAVDLTRLCPDLPHGSVLPGPGLHRQKH